MDIFQRGQGILMLQAFPITARRDIEDLPVQHTQFAFRFCRQFKDRKRSTVPTFKTAS